MKSLVLSSTNMMISSQRSSDWLTTPTDFVILHVLGNGFRDKLLCDSCEAEIPVVIVCFLPFLKIGVSFAFLLVLECFSTSLDQSSTIKIGLLVTSASAPAVASHQVL